MVCTPTADPSVTPKLDAMFNPKSEISEFNIGD
jgi:hypothetical protein